MIELFGVSIHEPDVAFTDLGLALLAAYFARRLWTAPGRKSLSRAGAVLMGALAGAALWGAIFHAFFPAGTATRLGFIAWIPVALSILVAAVTMLELGLRVLAPRLPPAVRQSIVAPFAVAFGVVVLLVDESFTSIVRFYVPALILFLVAAGQQAARARSPAWALIATGLIVSVGAAALQQARVSVHPVYFDHNALYHLVQSIAVVILYLGFRHAAEVSGSAHAIGTGPAPRQG